MFFDGLKKACCCTRNVNVPESDIGSVDSEVNRKNNNINTVEGKRKWNR